MAEAVLVAGASGRLGREVVRELKARGCYVRALARDAVRLWQNCPTADERIALDLRHSSRLRSSVANMTAVVSCAGASVIPTLLYGRESFSAVDLAGNLRLIEAAKSAGVNRFVYVSVFTGEHEVVLRDNDFVRAHRIVEEALARCGLSHAVVRSTGFFSSLAEIMTVASCGLLPVPSNTNPLTNPIHEADLADFCANMLSDGRSSVTTDAGGPEILRRSEIAQLVHGERSPIRIPARSLTAMAALLGPMNPRIAHLLAFISEVLSRDFVAPVYGSRSFRAFLTTDATMGNLPGTICA